MPEIWNQFAKLYEQHAKPATAPWKAAPDQADIEAFEVLTGTTFPDEFKAYLVCCDRPSITLCTPWMFLSLEEMRTAWNTTREVSKHGGAMPIQVEAVEAGINAVYDNPKWIPFISAGSGDYHCVDLDPALGGTVGQIISVFNARDDRTILAKGIKEYFELLISELENGNLHGAKLEEDEEGLEAKEGTAAARIFTW